MSDTWHTTVEGTTYTEIHKAAVAEYERFFGYTYTEDTPLDLHIHASHVVLDGSGSVQHTIYEADVVVKP